LTGFIAGACHSGSFCTPAGLSEYCGRARIKNATVHGSSE